MKNDDILKKMYSSLQRLKVIIGVSTCSGDIANYAENSGADFIMALNSGYFRRTGRGSLAGYLPFLNSNEMVMDFAKREILTIVHKIPVLFGLFATDPTVDIEKYIGSIKQAGFAGITNYPTVGLLSGSFQQALYEAGDSYDREVEAIAIAHKMGMLTIPFVFDEEQCQKMLDAGADIICIHLGLTKGGNLGAKRVVSIHSAIDKINSISRLCHQINPGGLVLIYGGPVKSVYDLKYVMESTDIHGYVGGSTFDRIPLEQGISVLVQEFKESNSKHVSVPSGTRFNSLLKKVDYIDVVEKYVNTHYMEEISVSVLAESIYCSRGYLSTLIKREVGCTFSEYLTNVRISHAKMHMEENKYSLTQIAYMVGFNDYATFSKTFRKCEGVPPRNYLKTVKKTVSTTIERDVD